MDAPSPSTVLPPAFSVVIPTYNRWRQLGQCLEAVLQLQAPAGGFEVVVVDDGSDDDSQGVLQAWCQQFAERGIDLLAVRQPNAGPAAARNRGASLAGGRWLAFTDDDCLVEPGWLWELERVFTHQPESLVGGSILNLLADNPFACASQDLLDYLYAAGLDGRFSLPFFGSANLALSAEGFARLGGFDHHYTRAASEDREICDRWLRQGGCLRYVPAARIWHAHPMGFREFWRQHLAYGRGAFQFHRARSHRQRMRLRIEPIHFYAGLLIQPLQQGLSRQGLHRCLLLMMSQVAALLGFLLEAMARPRCPGLRQLPVARDSQAASAGARFTG
jgi:glycosyltransferase involved in cell wall biosynthesis